MKTAKECNHDLPAMTQHFAVLPAPDGYQLIEINDNYVEGEIDRWLSEPRPVLGFVIRRQEIYFSVLPITVSGVYDDGGTGQYALIRPDGKIDYRHCGEYIFDSIEGLKIYLLRTATQLFREMASDSDVDSKDAAQWRHHARKLEKEVEAFRRR